MKISEMLSPNAVNVDLKSSDKDGIIEELVGLLVASGDIKSGNKGEIIDKLREREALGSTGIGKGVGIPHAKSSKTKKMISAFGISKGGVDFKSLDGAPAYIFFLLVAPGDTPGPHLKALAKISRLLDDKFVRERLRAASSSADALRIMKEEEQKAAK